MTQFKEKGQFAVFSRKMLGTWNRSVGT